MSQNHTDWKDVANSYYDKCLAITLIFAIFAIMVFPEVEIANIRQVERIIESIEILPEIREEIPPPEEVIKPIVNIEIVDDFSDGDDDNILILDTIDVTILNPFEDIAPPRQEHGTTSKFVDYDEPPVVLSRVAPVYPTFAINARLQGTVTLDIEVFADGTIGAIEVFRSVQPGPGGLDEAAINAVRQWRIQPAKAQGQPVSVWLRQPIVFSL
jgi:protein TonB